MTPAVQEGRENIFREVYAVGRDLKPLFTVETLSKCIQHIETSDVCYHWQLPWEEHFPEFIPATQRGSGVTLAVEQVCNFLRSHYMLEGRFTAGPAHNVTIHLDVNDPHCLVMVDYE